MCCLLCSPNNVLHLPSIIHSSCITARSTEHVFGLLTVLEVGSSSGHTSYVRLQEPRSDGVNPKHNEYENVSWRSIRRCVLGSCKQTVCEDSTHNYIPMCMHQVQDQRFITGPISKPLLNVTYSRYSCTITVGS